MNKVGDYLLTHNKSFYLDPANKKGVRGPTLWLWSGGDTQHHGASSSTEFSGLKLDHK